MFFFLASPSNKRQSWKTFLNFKQLIEFIFLTLIAGKSHLYHKATLGSTTHQHGGCSGIITPLHLSTHLKQISHYPLLGPRSGIGEPPSSSKNQEPSNHEDLHHTHATTRVMDIVSHIKSPISHTRENHYSIVKPHPLDHKSHLAPQEDLCTLSPHYNDLHSVAP